MQFLVDFVMLYLVRICRIEPKTELHWKVEAGQGITTGEYTGRLVVNAGNSRHYAAGDFFQRRPHAGVYKKTEPLIQASV